MFSKFFSGKVTTDDYDMWRPFTNRALPTTPQFIVSSKNGFLPRQDPLEKLPQRFNALESLLQRMPLYLPNGENGLLYTGRFGEAVDEELPLYHVNDITDSALLMALFRDYTFVASAYLLEPCDITRRTTNQFGRGRSVLPASIAVPLTEISEKISAKPFMEYAQSYALYNYRRIDKNKDLSYDNLELIRKFSGMKSEHGFILVHVDMVAKTPQLVENVIEAMEAVHADKRGDFDSALTNMVDVLQMINSSMEGMWKRSSPMDYMKFRTFIMGTKNQKGMFPDGVIYEGVSDEPQFYRGESGANDSIIPTMDNFLQITDKLPKNEMTDILKDFRTYRPHDHTRWLTWVENTANTLQLATYVQQSSTSLTLYILLLDQVREFRARHWNFAKEYIIKRTQYPQATGGSPMATWLPNQLSVVLDTILDNSNRLNEMQGYLGSISQTVFEKAQRQKKMLGEDVTILTTAYSKKDGNAMRKISRL